MTQPSISIIIPVYNVGPYVEDCLRSVMRQTYTGPMECIIVDDCGTDNSMAIVDRMIADYKGPIDFKILHHTHNRGLSAARNTGIDAATGDYLFFLDSDDILVDNCIFSLWDKASSDSAIEIVVGNAKIFPEVDIRFIQKEFTVTHATTNSEVRSCFYHSGQLICNAWNKLIKRVFLQQHGIIFKEGIIHEDFLWAFYLVKYATNVFFHPDITYLYRHRDGSITASTQLSTRARSELIIHKDILNNLSTDFGKDEYFFFATRFLWFYHTADAAEIEEVFHIYWKKAIRFAPRSYYILTKALCSKICHRLKAYVFLRKVKRRVLRISA